MLDNGGQRVQGVISIFFRVCVGEGGQVRGFIR